MSSAGNIKLSQGVPAERSRHFISTMTYVLCRRQSKKVRILIKGLKSECISFEMKDESFTTIWHGLFTSGDFEKKEDNHKMKINTKKGTDIFKCVFFFLRFVMNDKLKF